MNEVLAKLITHPCFRNLNIFGLLQPYGAGVTTPDPCGRAAKGGI